MENNPTVSNVTRFSNEVHLRLYSCINKQNVQFWVSWNPRFTVANPRHPRESHSMVLVIERCNNMPRVH
jgi:hypothetical protein